jgi:hypothetical protein
MSIYPAKDEEYSDMEMMARFSSFSAKINLPLKITALTAGEHLGTKAKVGNLEIEVFSSNYKKIGQKRDGLSDIKTLRDYTRKAPCNRRLLISPCPMIGVSFRAANSL